MENLNPEVEKKTQETVRALLVIDVQNDFIDGSLAVPDAKSIIPVINKLRSKKFDYVYMCLDWHPFNHCSFRTNNPGSNVFQVVHLPSTGDAQIMWPDHCVQGTRGADIHKDVLIESSDIFTYAGCNPQRDSYSVFKDNGSTVLTDMRDLLEENHVTEIYAVGLATDFCVQYTVLDAKILLQNVDVFFIQDGCRGIQEDSIASAMKKFSFEKIHVIQSDSPEICMLEDRKINIHGYQLNKRAVGWSDTVCEEIDELYETVIIDRLETDLDMLERCITSGIINQLCSWSCKNILHGCCESGSVEILEFLLERGGNILDITSRSKKDENALMLAVCCKVKQNRQAMIEILLDHASDDQQRELLYAQTSQQKMTALMYACRDGDCETVEMLLSYDSSMQHLQLQSTFGKTAIMFACMTDSKQHAAVIEVILRSLRSVDDRLTLLSQSDFEAWTSLHFAAKSGCFAGVDWSRCLDGYENLARLPVNAMTISGISFLHLAAFNGKSEVIRSILDSQQPNKRKKDLLNAILKKSLKHKIKVNVPVRATDDSELDLALQRRHLECARLLLRLGSHAKTSSPQALHELLHRLVLMGDVEACESILNFADENSITVDDTLVEITQRMEHPETCTFSFASYNNTITQFIYQCVYCNQKVCLVCKDRCHGVQSCRKDLSKLDLEHNPNTGWAFIGLSNTHCECKRESCCATPATDMRELEGYRYIPNPISTSTVRISVELSQLSKRIARNTHNVWAKQKVDGGWKYGRDNDENEKLHPHLLPFSSLSYEGTKYNMDMAVETLKVILALGYSLQHEDHDEEEDEKNSSGGTKEPPTLSKQLAGKNTVSAANDKGTSSTFQESLLKNSATKLLAKSVSELVQKKRDTIVPALFAKDEFEKPKPHRRLLTISGVDGNPKYAEIAWRAELPECKVIDTAQVTIPVNLKKLIGMIAANSHEVWASEKIRQGFRYAPARNIKKGLNLNSSLVPFEYLTEQEKKNLLIGVEETVKVILSYGWSIEPPAGQEEEEESKLEEVADKMKLVPARKHSLDNHAKRNFAFRQLKHIRRKLFNQYLFAAVRRGQIDSVNILLSKRASMYAGANLNAIDEYGHTPLYIAIKRGHFDTARRLLHLGANVEIRDVNGLTPLALSAYLGNIKLCQELVQNSARLLVVDNMGFTPLHHAAYQGHTAVCRYLTERLQQENQANEIVDLNANIQALLAKDAWGGGADESRVKSPKQKQRSPSGDHHAAGSVSLFRQIVRASVSKKTFSKINPLDIGAIPHQTQIFSTPRSPRVSQGPSEMSTPRFSLHSMNSESAGLQRESKQETIADLKLADFSPLSMAIRSNNIEVVSLLIKFGGNPMQEDGNKKKGNSFSPYVRALFRHVEMTEKVEYLKEQISQRVFLDLQAVNMKAHSTKVGIFDKNGKARKQLGVGAPVAADDTGQEEDGAKFQKLGLPPFRNRLKLIRKADSKLANFFGFHLRQEEKQMQISKSTRELDEMLEKASEDCAHSARMVEVLNQSAKVRAWRKKCALKMFVRETFSLLIMIFVFGLIIQLAPDYDYQTERRWGDEMTAFFQGRVGDVETPGSFIDWMEREVDAHRTEGKPNIMFGKMTFTAGETCREVYDLDEFSNFDDIRQQTVENATFPFIVEFNMYNGANELYGAVEVVYHSPFAMLSAITVDVFPFRLWYRRFPPSRTFQVVLAAMVVTFSFSKVRNLFSTRRRKKSKTEEWITAFLLVGILIFDMYLYNVIQVVPMNPTVADDTAEFNSCSDSIQLSAIYRLLEIERRSFAVFFLLSVIPLLNAARTIPSIGPVVVALLNTMTHSAVLIYLMVVAVSCFMLTLTFHVGFGNAGPALVTTSVTFETLFISPFIDTWDGIQSMETTGFLGSVLSIFYIMFATITLNLLIAIVTDVYPNCRSASDRLWEEIITQGIEESLKDLVHEKLTKKNALFIEFWNTEVLLFGKDGIKHWKADVSSDERHKDPSSEISALRDQIAQLTDLVKDLAKKSAHP